MKKSVISILLCFALVFSFSVVSFASTEDDLKAFETVGETVHFGYYEQDNDLNNGKEPIEWLVLDVQDGKSLLLSKYAIEILPLDDEANTSIWKDCSLRHWLNDDFILSAFSEEERDCILLSEIDNSKDQDYPFWSRGGSENTNDYSFLLSYAEFKKYYGILNEADSFFSSDFYTLTEATSFAKSKVIGKPKFYSFYENDGNHKVHWWLRSPSLTSGQGIGASIKPKNSSFTNWYFGINPAFWLDLNALKAHPEILIQKQDAQEEKAVTPANTITDNSLPEHNWEDNISGAEFIKLGETNWKLWLPEGFAADELTEEDLADHYIGYYLSDDKIVAAQYLDIDYTLDDYQAALAEKGLLDEGMFSVNGIPCLIYRNPENDSMSAAYAVSAGKLLEITFYPCSDEDFREQIDTMISSVQPNGSQKKRLSGSASSSETVVTSQEQAYAAMVSAYKEGKYSDSYKYYETAVGYQDADKYGNLLKARLCYALNLSDSEIESLEKAIVRDISFADSADVLVCNNLMAHYYLLGYWRTSNGMHGYEVKEDWGSTTTVPAIPKSGDYYVILDGTYWSYFDGKWEDRVAQYKFTPISKNQMKIYSYQAKQSYTFNKIR